jgi:hypothetical protein
LPPADYSALISRSHQLLKCQVHHWTTRQPLPAIPIPLLPSDLDAWIDIGALFTTAYDRGRYGRSLDYSAPPPVSLDPDRLAWAPARAGGGNPA